jgi:fibronectin type 3 domain-containing protein
VDLSWQVDVPAEVLQYFIYRREADQAAAVRVDSTESVSYTDLGLTNGAFYLYQISAVRTNGLEGKRSKRLQVSPGVFGVLLDGGAAVTRQRTVAVNLTAPTGTSSVKLGDSAELTAAAAQPFAQTREWTLPSGDGDWTVYAQFITQEGHPSAVFSDEIRLDTRAAIASVAHDAEGRTLTPGEHVRFRMDAGEPYGEATVDLGAVRTGLVLFDDGSHGDAQAEDGVYELDYAIEEGVELVDGLVTGRFTDEAGNGAGPVSAPARLSIHQPPAAVVLSSPFAPTETSLSLMWTQSNAANFAFYRIVRAESAGADGAATRINVADVTSRSTTTYVDAVEIEENKTYFYQVHVYDTGGFFSRSNETSSTTLDRAPAAVTLEQPTSVAQTELTLTWSRNADADFASYKIYRSAVPSVDLTDVLLATLDRDDVTTYRDSGLTENTTYYYRVFVFDRGGRATASNEVGPTTANARPASVTVTGTAGAASGEANLSWTQNRDHDFREYRVYRDLSPAVGTGSTLARAVTDRGSLAFVDRGLEENTRYYYRVFVSDTGDSLAGSNEIGIVTLNLPPAPVSLSLVDTTMTSVSLSWTQSGAADFASYQVYVATSPGVSTSGVPRATITQVNRLSTVVTGLNRASPNGVIRGQDYFFILVVEDNAGGRTPSNELRVRGESP